MLWSILYASPLIDLLSLCVITVMTVTPYGPTDKQLQLEIL